MLLRPSQRQRSTDSSDELANLRVGGPANDESYMSKYQPFQYRPIPGQGYIRLLHLKPVCAHPGELRGSLVLHRLNEHCVYEAISYAWGEFSSFNQVILLNGKVLKITDNLYAALMAYCRSHRDRVLWADAICINQADTAEKAQQVALMAEIYSMAKLVQVWLTLPSEWTMDAMKYIKDLSAKADKFGISKDVGQPRVVGGWPTVDITSSESEKLIHDANKHHVDFLLWRPWFNRVWVVQEVALAKDLVVSCGHTTLAWTDLARALEVLRGAYRKIRTGTDRSRMEGLKPAWALAKHRDEWRMVDQHLDRDHHFSTNMVGDQMRNKACTDDRDRVYAMLAMTKSPHVGMEPDYTKTVAEAYTEFTRRYSPNTQLHFAGLARRQPTTYQGTSDDPRHTHPATEGSEGPTLDITDRNYLPSWVPEFRPDRNLAWVSPCTGHYTTARLAPIYFLSHPGTPKIMLATGTLDLHHESPPLLPLPSLLLPLVDLLTTLLTSPPQWGPTVSEPPPIQLAKTLTSGVADCKGAESILKNYHFIRDLTHLVPGSLPWLTTIWTAFTTHCLEPTGEMYKAVLLKALSSPKLNTDKDTHIDPHTFSSPDAKIAYAFTNYLANILVPNRLFATYGGRIGLAPSMAALGDLLVVINGYGNLDSKKLVLVALSHYDEKENDSVYDELKTVYPPTGTKPDVDEDGKVIVGIISMTLELDPKRHGQYQPEEPDATKPPEDPDDRKRDICLKAFKILDKALKGPGEKWLTNHMEILSIGAHPGYWKRGHGHELTRWLLELADTDKVPTCVSVSPMGSKVFNSLGFVEKELVVLEGHDLHPEPIDISFEQRPVYEDESVKGQP
ncbi:uncharacterized protein N0V89_001622 [Didymosphaeria variabile]|uniref:Heterokaryon incompatibility domain-containing protein n=1 Tax=Didymosphaeria variabile TaxID=1932322 RepID=A0A9W9CG30_9PLEO|nr:uncharacterized protein N0V89_001622 [Didymosphaeria variabile]KAJ4361053.1 hypothetical protein N0V89_001622 [Didymosphaeria variabile]